MKEVFQQVFMLLVAVAVIAIAVAFIGIVVGTVRDIRERIAARRSDRKFARYIESERRRLNAEATPAQKQAKRSRFLETNSVTNN